MQRIKTVRKLTIYTDGSCNPNPGAGGWGYAIFEDGRAPIEVFGGELKTTNNQMELAAAVMALQALESRAEVTIYTDSQYVRKGITSWIKGWKRNGWLTASRQPVKNQELWQALEKVCANHLITWKWVKGHNGSAGNELADRLAAQGREKVLTDGNSKPVGIPDSKKPLEQCLALIKKMPDDDLRVLSDACSAAIVFRGSKVI